MDTVKYDCTTNLLKNLSDTVGGSFSMWSYEYPVIEKDKYEYLFIEMITILLTNRPYINEKFNEIDWGLSFEDFGELSTINKRSIGNYTNPTVLLEKDIKVEMQNDKYKYANLYYKGQITPEYNIYLEEKYNNTYDKKRYSINNPDTLDQITIDDYYYDKFGPSIEELLEKKEENRIKQQKRNEIYNDALQTLNRRLITSEGLPNINMIMQNIRNGLAHNHFKIENDHITIKNYNQDESKIIFEINLSLTDMLMITENYLYKITKIENQQKKNNITMILDDIFEGRKIKNFDKLYNYISEKDVNKIKILQNKYIEIEEKINKLIEEEEENLKPREEYNKEINAKVYEREQILLQITKVVNEIYIRNNPRVKATELVLINDDIIKKYKKYRNDKKYRLNHQLKEYDNDDDLEEINEKLYNDESLSVMQNYIKKTFDTSKYNDTITTLLVNSNVLLNLLFVQQNYDAIDTSSIIFDNMKINHEYIDYKNNVFKKDIENLAQKVTERENSLEKLKQAIKEGKVEENKVSNNLIQMQQALRQSIKALEIKKRDLQNALTFSNPEIFKHIRNSFAHGNAYINVLPYTTFSNIDDVDIIITDYEKNKLTFSGNIKLGALLEQVLNPEIMSQLMLQEDILNRNDNLEDYGFNVPKY